MTYILDPYYGMQVIKNPWIQHPDKKSIALWPFGSCKLLIPNCTSRMQVMLGAQPQLGIYPLVMTNIAIEHGHL